MALHGHTEHEIAATPPTPPQMHAHGSLSGHPLPRQHLTLSLFFKEPSLSPSGFPALDLCFPPVLRLGNITLSLLTQPPPVSFPKTGPSDYTATWRGGLSLIKVLPLCNYPPPVLIF